MGIRASRTLNGRCLDRCATASINPSDRRATQAKRLHDARMHWRALNDDQRDALRAAQLARPEPLTGNLQHRLWLAERRVAAKRALGT